LAEVVATAIAVGASVDRVPGELLVPVVAVEKFCQFSKPISAN
jgi:hypothetical protein